MYPYFANGLCENGRSHPRFERLMRRLASKNGWFVPVGNPAGSPGGFARRSRDSRWGTNCHGTPVVSGKLAQGFFQFARPYQVNAQE